MTLVSRTNIFFRDAAAIKTFVLELPAEQFQNYPNAYGTSAGRESTMLF